MRTFATTIIAATILAIGIASPGHVRAGGVPATAGTAVCAIHYIIGSQTCYAPAQELKAEQRAPFAVRPSAAVARLLRLSLAQIISYHPPPGSGNRIPASISYLYGVLRSDYGRAPGNPRSMIITEYPQSYTKFVPKYTRTVGGARFEISQASLNHPYRSYGPWYLIGNFAHRHASFTITANIPQGSLVQLATVLRRQA